MTDCNEEAVDPRVQEELEKLNTCTNEINRLETQLEEANAQFRNTLTESTQKLNNLSKFLGSAVAKARPYYEAKEIAKKAQLETHRAALQFQRAAGDHAAARETIALAEQRFLSHKNEWEFDTAWQEMLNHATSRVMEAEARKAESEVEHEQRAIHFRQAKLTVQGLEKQLKQSIIKSKPYFDEKDQFQFQLSLLKERIQNLQGAVSQAKQRYSQSLRNLEAISEEIHEKRRLNEPRQPGVGAENELQDANDNDSYFERNDSGIFMHKKEQASPEPTEPNEAREFNFDDDAAKQLSVLCLEEVELTL